MACTWKTGLIPRFLDISAISVDDIKEVLPKLSRQRIIALDQELHGYLETSILTRAGEESFKEWLRLFSLRSPSTAMKKNPPLSACPVKCLIIFNRGALCELERSGRETITESNSQRLHETNETRPNDEIDQTDQNVTVPSACIRPSRTRAKKDTCPH